MSDRTRDLDELRAALADRAADLAEVLVPDGLRSGRYWIGPRPGDGRKHKQNFWVNLQGAQSPGSWKDPVSGDKGGPLDLIMIATGLDFRGAVRWARDWLGWEQTTPEERRRTAEQMARRRAEAQARAAEDTARNRRRAQALWLQAEARVAGTPVEAYLAGRGIDVARLPHVPRALRFAVRSHRESERTFPAMLAMMTGPDEQFWSLHCTFLAEDGRDKAPVEPQRKMWPSMTGSAIRLARGETGLSIGEATKQGLLDTLCLCEGVEDGLSLALACPELRIWAVGSLANLAHVRLPACCAEVIVAADNDWANPQAARQLEAACEAQADQGRSVSVARSHVGKDANDALRGKA
ncbi:MAG: toprim domain-containing protein [Hyphomicrobiaceae bacterium]